MTALRKMSARLMQFALSRRPLKVITGTERKDTEGVEKKYPTNFVRRTLICRELRHSHLDRLEFATN